MTNPHSLEAEMGVLGSILLDPELFSTVELTSSQFFDARCATMWSQLQEHAAGGKHWDVITFSDYLATKGKLDRCGGYDFLVEIQEGVPVADKTRHYASIVAEKARLRHIIKTCEKASKAAMRGDDVTADIVTDLIGEPARTGMSDDDIMHEWDLASKGISNLVPTPFDSLNKIIGGFPRKMHTVLCGASGSGKSMLLSVIYEYLHRTGVPFLACPFEDKIKVTKTRMAAIRGRYNWSRVDRGYTIEKINDKFEKVNVTKSELQLAKKTLKSFDELHLYDERTTPDQLYRIASQYKSRYGIEAMFIDGAKDLVRPSGKYNDTGFDEEISQVLCKIAEQLDIAMVSIYHLTKLSPDELIQSQHIRGSGNIVSDARLALAFQRGGLENCNYDPKTKQQTTRRLDVIKSNHSPLGQVLLDTKLEQCRVYEEYVNA